MGPTGERREGGREERERGTGAHPELLHGVGQALHQGLCFHPWSGSVGVDGGERECGAATTRRASTADTRKWLAVLWSSLIQRPWVDRLCTAELQATDKRRFHPLAVRSERLQQATQVAARGQRRQVASVHPGCVQLDVSVASRCRQSKPMDALEERHLERVPQGVAHACRVDRRLLEACALARVSSVSRLEST